MSKKEGNFLAGLFAGGIIAWIVRGFLTTTKKITSVGNRNKRKAENKLKILSKIKEVDKICNDDVETLLGVSNATAERYLNELEKENHIKQIGKVGRSVHYIEKN